MQAAASLSFRENEPKLSPFSTSLTSITNYQSYTIYIYDRILTTNFSLLVSINNTTNQRSSHRFHLTLDSYIGSWLLLNSSGKYLSKYYRFRQIYIRYIYTIYFCTPILLLNIVRCSCFCVCQFRVTSVALYLSILLSLRCEPSPERCRVTSMIIVQEPQ